MRPPVEMRTPSWRAMRRTAARQLRDRARASARSRGQRPEEGARALRQGQVRGGLARGRRSPGRGAGQPRGEAHHGRRRRTLARPGCRGGANAGVARAKAAARSAGRARLAPAPYAAAIAAEREAQRLYQAGRRETRRSSSTKPAACSAAPRSPRRTRATARDVRAPAALPRLRRPKKPRHRPRAEAPPPRHDQLRSPAAACTARAGAEPAGSGARSAVRRRPPRQHRRRCRQAPPPEAPPPAPNPETGVAERACSRYKSALEVARPRRAEARVARPQRQRANRHPRRVQTREPDQRGDRRSAHLCIRRHWNGQLPPAIRGGDSRGTTAPHRDANDDGVRRSGATWVIERIRFEPAR